MKRPQLVGILNLTPDSFSGDGVWAGDAIDAARAQVLAGAQMLDVGAESTRPGATPLSPGEEWARLEPFLKAWALRDEQKAVPLSIDTRHPSTAKTALAMGATLINDVGGLSSPEMRKALAGYRCDIVVMHALSVPADSQQVWAANIDPVDKILTWKQATETLAAEAGIAPERLIFDPGLGFGKTAEQSLALALSANQLVSSGGRWLIGHSRKSFLTLFSDSKAADRDALTLAFSTQLAQAGVQYLRVHNVAAHAELFGKICT